MLESNGRCPKEKRNYHFKSVYEFGHFLKAVHEYYDPMWELFLVWQFAHGHRCSEVCALNIATDFKNDFWQYDYREAKTNKMIYGSPVSPYARAMLIKYVTLNAHRIKNGWLFPGKNGNKHISTEYVGTLWSKWRRLCAKIYKDESFLDFYWVLKAKYKVILAIKAGCKRRADISRFTHISPKTLTNILIKLRKESYISDSNELTKTGLQYSVVEDKEMKYRLGSHSVRRLHRDLITKEMDKQHIDLFTQKVLLHYEKIETLIQYKNEYDVLEKANELMPSLVSPLIKKATMARAGQLELVNY